MVLPQGKKQTQLGRSAVQVFAANECMNQRVLHHLDPAAWRAEPPGGVRSIAAIFTHMHNVRAKWIRLNAPHLQSPVQLNRRTCTPHEAAAGLAESAARCTELLSHALTNSPHGGGEFRRDGWAPSWPAGVEMLCYMLSHEAHHRGQVCLLAHQLGFPLPKEAAQQLWDWNKLWKECGSPAGPGR